MVRANQLYLLSLGQLLNDNHKPWDTREAQVPAYLIRTGRGRTILIDTGNPQALIGADLLNLGRIADLQAPVVAIGGAGTFDGVFLTGIIAGLLA